MPNLTKLATGEIPNGRGQKCGRAPALRKASVPIENRRPNILFCSTSQFKFPDSSKHFHCRCSLTECFRSKMIWLVVSTRLLFHHFISCHLLPHNYRPIYPTDHLMLYKWTQKVVANQFSGLFRFWKHKCVPWL